MGLPAANTFLALPEEAVELLDWLAEGSTVGAAIARYRAANGQVPDLDGLLHALEARGFVSTGLAADGGDAPPSSLPVMRSHFDAISPRTARLIFSRPAVAAACALIVGALAIVVANPQLMPDWSALFFPERLAVMGPSLLALGLAMIFAHEMAHLTAARAVGVSCRLGIGHRLWIPVAETDMTGIWAVERRRRYLPFLAGPLLDATTAAAIMLLLAAADQGWVTLSTMTLRIARAMFLIYLLNLLWQCYFFVRTDFYYVLANYFGCKNLLADTESYLRNRLARLIPRLGRRDQTHVPPAEMRVVRWYSLIWLLGRVVAISVLVLVQMPLAWNYLELLGRAIVGHDGGPGSGQGAVGAILFLLFFGAGLGLWMRSLRKKRTRLA